MIEIDEDAIDAQIFKDLHKTKTELEEYINILRKWAKTQHHFPEEPKYYLVRCLILVTKFSIEKAKQKLDMYYTVRNFLPEFFTCSPFSPDMKLHVKMWQIIPLPKVGKNQTRIIYHRLHPDYGDPKLLDFAKQIAQFLNVIELLIMEDKCWRFHYIMDLQGITVGHSLKINPMVMKKAALVLEKVYSNNLASMYFVNSPSFYETVLNNLIIPMYNPKLRERIKISCGTEILLNDFGKERMPKDIGGDEKSLEELQGLLWKNFENHKNRFETLSTLKTDESLRPTKLENDEFLGYYGNFKTINVD